MNYRSSGSPDRSGTTETRWHALQALTKKVVELNKQVKLLNKDLARLNKRPADSTEVALPVLCATSISLY